MTSFGPGKMHQLSRPVLYRSNCFLRGPVRRPDAWRHGHQVYPSLLSQVDSMWGTFVVRAGAQIDPGASRTIQIQVDGMTCSHCEEAVRKALQGVPFTDEVLNVSKEDGSATVTVRGGRVGGPESVLVALINAVRKAGFDPKMPVEK